MGSFMKYVLAIVKHSTVKARAYDVYNFHNHYASWMGAESSCKTPVTIKDEDDHSE